MDARAHGLAVMITPLHGVGHRFESGWAHSLSWHPDERFKTLGSRYRLQVVTELPDHMVLRPAEAIGDASRLQEADRCIPSAESSPPRNLDERSSNTHRLIVMALLVLFALFVVFIFLFLD